jgi:hypothetical protein
MPDASGSLSTALPNQNRDARCIEASKRVRWDIDRDVIRGRTFDLGEKFLPDALSFCDRLTFLSADDRRLLGQIQGRTYANMFGLVERYIGAKIAEVMRGHALGDQVAFEALVRFTDEELKHQALFRRIEALTAAQMPDGYHFAPDPDQVADFVLGKSTWGVLALTCHIELFSQAHYRESIGDDNGVSPLFKDVFLFHWKEESQHAILDELEWVREDAKVSPEERSAAVTDLIALVGGIDAILQEQAMHDARYFAALRGSFSDDGKRKAIEDTVLAAYRWQYILSGAQHPHFVELLQKLCAPQDFERVVAALAPLATA